MKNLSRVAVHVLLGLSLVCATASAAPPARPQTRHYVCIACGLPCDAKVFDQPGTCPACGMALVDQAVAAAQAAATPAPRKVGILIFNGVEIIDYTGPWEVFGAAGFDVYTVAETREPVTTAMGMTVVPKYTFADAPQPDVLLVPGGGVKAAQGSAPTLKWIRDMTAHTQHTMSVCNGAFILANTGLLDGLTATTTYSNIDRMKTAFPKVRVVDNQRVVDNGKIITTGGLSAGIDGALHVVSRLLGNGTAQAVALSEEYDWRPHSGFVRAALADRLIPEPDLDSTGKWDIVSTEGGTDRWDIVVRGTSQLSATELMDRVGQAFVTRGKWVRAKAASAGPARAMTSDWKFSGRDGKPWSGTFRIEPVPGAAHAYTARVTIARVG